MAHPFSPGDSESPGASREILRGELGQINHLASSISVPVRKVSMGLIFRNRIISLQDVLAGTFRNELKGNTGNH